VAACAEFFGGLALIEGLLTSFAAAALIAVMTAAVLAVHLPNGFFNTDQGYEFNLALGVATFVLAGAGPGAWSVDNALGSRSRPRDGRSARSSSGSSAAPERSLPAGATAAMASAVRPTHTPDLARANAAAGPRAPARLARSRRYRLGD
jgi:hypothetical protein